MNQKIWLLVVGIISLFSYGGASSHIAYAAPLAARWEDAACTNVLGSERGLWLDTAGGDGEAGLFWMKTNEALNERCSITSYFPYLSSNTFPLLEVRVAVNDGARFTVTLYEEGMEWCSKVKVVSTVFTNDNSKYNAPRRITVPPGHPELCAVTITIDDDPDAVNSWRANALIDYIKIWDGTNVGWQETFTGGNP